MKRSPSRSATKNLADELAELRGLDPAALSAAHPGREAWPRWSRPWPIGGRYRVWRFRLRR